MFVFNDYFPIKQKKLYLSGFRLPTGKLFGRCFTGKLFEYCVKVYFNSKASLHTNGFFYFYRFAISGNPIPPGMNSQSR